MKTVSLSRGVWFVISLASLILALLFVHSHRSDSNVFKSAVVSGTNPPISKPDERSSISSNGIGATAINPSDAFFAVRSKDFPGIYEIYSAIETNRASIVFIDSLERSAEICPDGQSIAIKKNDGSIILKTNVIAGLVSMFQLKGPEALPITGPKKIYSIQVIRGYLVVDIGKFLVYIDKHTGEVAPLGSD